MLTFFRFIERLRAPALVNAPLAEGDRVDEALFKLQGQIASGVASDVLSPAYPILPFRAIAVSSAGLAEYADFNNPDHAGAVIGISLDGLVTIRPIGGVTNPAWDWTPGLPVFVGPDGFLTQDGSGGVFVQPIGTAKSANEITIRIGLPVRRAV